MCVIGEPTMMQLALAHKGKTVFRAQCCGEEGHSALAPNYVNAIHVASKLVESLQNVQQHLREKGIKIRVTIFLIQPYMLEKLQVEQP